MIEATKENITVKRSLINQYIGGILYANIKFMSYTELSIEEKLRVLTEVFFPENEIYYNKYKNGEISYEQFHTGEHEKVTKEEAIQYNKENTNKLFELAGSGTNRVAFRCGEYIFKFALDELGETDNRREMFYSKKLFPYATKVYECTKSGSISVQEYVRVMDMNDLGERRSDMLEILDDLSQTYLFGDISASGKNVGNWGIRRDDDSVCILDFAYIYKTDSTKFECPSGCKNPETGTPTYLRYDLNYVKLQCPCCRKTYEFQEYRSIADGGEELEIETKIVDIDYTYQNKIGKSQRAVMSNSKPVKNPDTGKYEKDYSDGNTTDMYYIIKTAADEIMVSNTIDNIKVKKDKKLSEKKLLKLELERRRLDDLYINNKDKFFSKIEEMSDEKFDKLFNTNFNGEDNEMKRKVEKVDISSMYEDYTPEELMAQNDALENDEITYEEWLAGDMSNWVPGVKVSERGSYDIESNEPQTIEDMLNIEISNKETNVVTDESINNIEETVQRNTHVAENVQYNTQSSNKRYGKVREIKFDTEGLYGQLGKLAVSDGVTCSLIDLSTEETLVKDELNDPTKCMNIQRDIINSVLLRLVPSAILTETEFNNIIRYNGINDPQRITFIKVGNYVLCYVINKHTMNTFNKLAMEKYSDTLSMLMNMYTKLAYKFEFNNAENLVFSLSQIESFYNSSVNEKESFINYYKKIKNQDNNINVIDAPELKNSYLSGMYYLTDNPYFEIKTADEQDDIDNLQNDDEDELPVYGNSLNDDDIFDNDIEASLDLVSLLEPEDDVFDDEE